MSFFSGDYCKSEELSDIDSFAAIVPETAKSSLFGEGYGFDDHPLPFVIYQLQSTRDIMDFKADIVVVPKSPSADIRDARITVEVKKDSENVIAEVCEKSYILIPLP